MSDVTTSLIGTAIVGIPVYVVMWLALRKQPRAIFQFGTALLAVGLGYLIATGATADIGRRAVAFASPAKSGSPAMPVTPTPVPAPAR